MIAELDRLPLALAHAAAVIRRQRIPYTTYLERLRAFPVERFLPRHAGDPYPLSTAQAILLSTDVAVNADGTGLTWGLLAVLSTMPTAARWVLHAVAAEAMKTPGVQADVDAALGALADNSTLSLDGAGVAMHRVTARVVRDQEERGGRIGGLVLVGCQGLEALTQQRDWPEQARAEHLVDQIDTLFSVCRDNDIPVEFMERVLALRRWAADYLFHAAEPARAVAARAALLADCQRLFGKHDPVMITELAAAHLRAEQFDAAIELLTEQQLAGTDDMVAESLDLSGANLAMALEKAGRLDEAISLHEQVMRRRIHAFGEHYPVTWMAAFRLAGAYRSADRLDDAISLLAPTETDCVIALGVGHLLTLDVRCRLADLYSSAERPDEAITLLKTTIADWRRTQPDGTIPLLKSCLHLVYVYLRAQRIDEAIELCESLHRETTRQHPTTLALRRALAESYLKVGRTTDAVNAFASLAADTERLLGPQHPHTANCQSRLAHARHTERNDHPSDAL